MMGFAFFVILALGLVGVWLAGQYNWFVKAKTRISASVQEIGNQLKRQADLIPNLTASVKGYMKHESDVFTKLTEARKSVTQAVMKTSSAQAMVEAGEKLQRALAPIQAVFESTPELKANETVTKLMAELRDTADKVMYSRRTLIDLVADYNARLLTFPTSLVASAFNFKREEGLKSPDKGEHLEVKAEETKTPKVDLS
ncbi:LemA family protein [Patescibacteria group bacterium]|nr:LemA family protein [Patescibacteria group bacterium]